MGPWGTRERLPWSQQTRLLPVDDAALPGHSHQPVTGRTKTKLCVCGRMRLRTLSVTSRGVLAQPGQRAATAWGSGCSYHQTQGVWCENVLGLHLEKEAACRPPSLLAPGCVDSFTHSLNRNRVLFWSNSEFIETL